MEVFILKKRFFALGFAFVLCLCLLAGCGGVSDSADSSSDDESSSSDETLTDIPDEAYDDIVYYLTDGAVSSDDVVYTVNGADLTASEYFYWITYEAYVYSYTYYSSYYYYPDLTEEYSDGTTMADYVVQDAYYYATLYTCVYAKALEAGVSLSDTYQTSLDSYIPDSVTSLGEDLWDTAVAAGTVDEDDYTDEEKEEWIEEQGELEMALSLMYYATDTDGIYNIYLKSYFYQQYEDVLYGDGGEYEVTDEEIAAYAEENEAYNCRYILFGDPDGDFDDDELEEYYEEALACYEELLTLSGDDLDEAIAEYAADNPDSNTTGELAFDSSSTVLDEFLDVLENLEIGEIGMTEASEDGYYVIIRDEVTADTELADSYTVYWHYVDDAFGDLVTEWVEEMEVVDTGVLDDFVVTDFFDNLDALRDIIDVYY